MKQEGSKGSILGCSGSFSSQSHDLCVLLPFQDLRKRGCLTPKRLLKLKGVQRHVGIYLGNTKCVTLRKRCTFLMAGWQDIEGRGL